MDISIWLRCAYALLGIIATLLSTLIPLIKKEKTKRNLENAIKIANAVKPYIVEAEKFTHYTGAEKKAYVMTKARQYAIDNNIKIADEDVSAQVEEEVSLTKNVNQRDKDKNV